MINELKNKSVDPDGFKQIYIAKDKILTESQVFHNGKPKFSKEKGSPRQNGGSNKYIYWPKNKTDGPKPQEEEADESTKPKQND